jgi:thiol-disulfide isomerase/thioredoxin
MLRSPIYAVVGAVILVLAVGAIALYGIEGDDVQRAHTPPAVLDKLRLTRHQVPHRGERGERRRRWDGERGERQRTRWGEERGERRHRRDGGRGERRRRWDDEQYRPPQADGAGGAAQQQPDGYQDQRAERRGQRGDRRRAAGSPASVSWTDANGNRVRLADFRGRFVVLNLWATWCAPCITELPALARAQAALARDKVQVIAVDLENQAAVKVAEFLKAHGAGTLPVHIDKDLALMRAFRAYALPLTILYDKNGREFGRAEGPQKWDDPEAIGYLRDMADEDVTAGEDRRQGRDRRDERGFRGLFRMFRWFGH